MNLNNPSSLQYFVELVQENQKESSEMAIMGINNTPSEQPPGAEYEDHFSAKLEQISAPSPCTWTENKDPEPIIPERKRRNKKRKYDEMTSEELVSQSSPYQFDQVPKKKDKRGRKKKEDTTIKIAHKLEEDFKRQRF